ncbi:hypothetical protein DV737_g1094, partial [Chaetothyriales sp. CBS 132003]
MADSSQPTQPATQRVEDARRLGRHVSDISNDDLSDVICILHPQTAAAIQAIPATMLANPQHVLQNDDLQGIDQDDLLLPQFREVRDIALRISSEVKSPADGFLFGRNPHRCDVMLTDNPGDSLVSQRHFKIYVNSQGSLMIQDLSTNGTIVDDDVLRSKARRDIPRPSTRVLKNGTLVGVISGHSRAEVKFLVRIPNRGDHEDAYEERLRKYLERRGTVANFASMRESAYGNVWNGGSIYSFTGNLGRGAFATVYRVQTKRDGNIYAAKELDKRRFMKNGHLDVKFDNELKIMQNLKHPNIVEYVDSHSHGNHVYIIMECISGGELQTELRARQSLLEPEVQQIARQMLHALRYLHRRGITHRDIKPDNILIACRKPLVVKLSDFGLSKCVSDQETFLKTFCGTLLYCAPEVYPEYAMYASGGQPKRRRAGEHAPRISPYSEAVDMWSFGAVLFHLLCGKPPFLGRGDDRCATMLINIMTKDVDFGLLRAAGVSEDGIHLISLLLQRDPRARPNEVECLEHAWLRRVADVFEYEEDGPEPDVIRRALDAIEEAEDEDDFRMLEEVQQLTQPPAVAQDDSASLSPGRPRKKIRGVSEERLDSADIQYPALPSLGLASFPPPSSGPGQNKLFGEITNSAIRSSGVFGLGVGAPEMAVEQMAVEQMAVEQMSIKDFRNAGAESSEKSVENVSLAQFPVPPTKGKERVDESAGGSAASLLGAEQQIGQLRVGSPRRTKTDKGNAEAQNGAMAMAMAGELSATGARGKEAEAVNGMVVDEGASHGSEIGKLNRQVDVGLLEDDIAYEAELRAREESRAERKRRAERLGWIEVADAVDAGTEGHRRPGGESLVVGGLQSPTLRLDEVGFAKPARRFGKLSSTAGSFGNITIHLEDRGTIWGRSPCCTHQHSDINDTRIPKVAMRVIFWAPGMEAHEKRGGDWTELAGIQTVISTSASAGILVNGFKLTERSKDGAAALYGKIYSGDTITVYESNDQSAFLKFKVEITYGSSAMTRPEKEQPFQVQREKKFYSEYVQRESVRRSMQEKGPSAGLRKQQAGEARMAAAAV